MLILGKDLICFLRARRVKSKRPCRPGEIYCVRCREPKVPRDGVAEYRGTNPNLGNLVGICPVCNCQIHRRVNPRDLPQITGTVSITPPKRPVDIGESYRLSVNSDLEQGGDIHAHAQSEQRANQASVFHLSQGSEAAQRRDC